VRRKQRANIMRRTVNTKPTGWLKKPEIFF